MVRAPILDGGAVLYDSTAGVDQHREAPDRPQRGELLQPPWVLLRQQAPFERRAVLVQRHQHLLAVRGKRVCVEEQVAGCGGGRGGWHGGSGASWGIHVIGVAAIETLSGGDERAGPESTRVEIGRAHV